MRARLRHLSIGLLAGLLSLALAAPLGAQQDAANITEIVRVEVASENEDAFEEGVKAHHENVRAQGGEETTIIWEIVTGKHAGDYQVGLVGRTWASFGETTVEDPEALQQSLEENVTPHVEDIHVSFWRHAEELSYSPSEGEDGPSPLTTVTFYEVKDGEAFTNAIERVKRAAEDAGYDEYGWAVHELEYGGGSTWAIVSGQDGWADLAEPETTLGEVFEEATSEYEAEALGDQFDEAVKDSDSHILEYREELSYIPEEGEM